MKMVPSADPHLVQMPCHRAQVLWAHEKVKLLRTTPSSPCPPRVELPAVLVDRLGPGHNAVEIFQYLEPPQFLLRCNNISTSFTFRSIHPIPFDTVQTSMLIVSEAQLQLNVQVTAVKKSKAPILFPSMRVALTDSRTSM